MELEKLNTEQLRVELIAAYRTDHHYSRSAGHPAIDRRIERDVQRFTEILDEIIKRGRDGKTGTDS